MTTPVRDPRTSLYVTGAVLDSMVALLLVKSGERSNAMTLSFFAEVAHHPTSLWISVATSRYTHQLLEAEGRFSLALLTQNQREIAVACAAVSGRDRDKCATLPLRATTTGFFYLDGALTSSGCRVRERIPLGDHTVFVAEILEGESDTSIAHVPPLRVSDLATD